MVYSLSLKIYCYVSMSVCLSVCLTVFITTDHRPLTTEALTTECNGHWSLVSKWQGVAQHAAAHVVCLSTTMCH